MSSSTSSSRLAVVAAAAAAAISLTGCGPGGGAGTGTPSPNTSSGTRDGSSAGAQAAPGASADDPAGKPAYAAYYTQKPTWTACEKTFECTTVTVPMNWADPAGTTIRLATIRRRATGTKVGSLLINPGGPGGSGLEALQGSAEDYGRPVRDSYDLVSWDPRGIGKSHPVTCLTDKQMDASVADDETPDSPAEISQMQRDIAKTAATCRTTPAGLLAHVDTISTAKDLDVLRAVLGDQKLHYFGYSYGTFLGAWYAELFPGRVGRMVLDAPMDPSIPAAERNRAQSHGFTRAFDSFLTACLKSPKCPVTGTPAHAKQQVIALAARVDARPLHTTLHRDLTEALLVTGLAQALYSPQLWNALAQGLHDALKGDGTVMLQLADLYYERDEKGHYGQQSSAGWAIHCLDSSDTRPVAEIAADAALARKTDPLFGESNAWSALGCRGWRYKPVVHPRKLTAEGAAPILVVGTTKDPATPVEWSRALAGQLSSGVLLTRDGDGHTGYGSGSNCTDEAVEDYLTQGIVPAKGTVCT